MADWVDNYIDNEGYNSDNHAFEFTSGIAEGRVPNTLSRSLVEVIRQCSYKETELNEQSFKKLKITVVDECCFNTIKKLESKKDSKYEYLIFLPDALLKEPNIALVKHKIAHEIAHFLFVLQGKTFNNNFEEQKECNKKAEKWGFPEESK